MLSECHPLLKTKPFTGNTTHTNHISSIYVLPIIILSSVTHSWLFTCRNIHSFRGDAFIPGTFNMLESFLLNSCICNQTGLVSKSDEVTCYQDPHSTTLKNHFIKHSWKAFFLFVKTLYLTLLEISFTF